jgi:hypothetical protein
VRRDLKAVRDSGNGGKEESAEREWMHAIPFENSVLILVEATLFIQNAIAKATKTDSKGKARCALTRHRVSIARCAA